ncbi:MAG TPA: glycosyltransferase [Armatimonadota bacterium]|nr:glycosyltransferase [Armatimonadota bacterium]
MKSASVIIPSYKSKDTIIPVVSAVMGQETDVPFEVIVVESSNDGTAEMVRERFPEVKVIASKERLLGGAARNIGAEEASGELIYNLDADCIPEKDWLARMWQAHRDWDCAAVGGSLINGNPESLSSIACYIQETSDFYPSGRPRYMDNLGSGNVSYKAAVYRKHNGFDTDAVAYVDVLFHRRLHNAGEKLLFMPDIKVAHFHRTTLGDYLRHMKKRGRASVNARRKGLLPGASLARNPLIALLAAPILFARKGIVYPYRAFKAFPSESPRLAQALPYFYLGLAAWHYGFLSEVLVSRKDVR